MKNGSSSVLKRIFIGLLLGLHVQIFIQRIAQTWFQSSSLEKLWSLCTMRRLQWNVIERPWKLQQQQPGFHCSFMDTPTPGSAWSKNSVDLVKLRLLRFVADVWISVNYFWQLSCFRFFSNVIAHASMLRRRRSWISAIVRKSLCSSVQSVGKNVARMNDLPIIWNWNSSAQKNLFGDGY